MANNKLFQEFPEISAETWRKKIEEDLKGADFHKKLVWKTEEEFEVQPYYRKEDLEKLNKDVPESSPEEKPGNDWKIRQDFKPGDSPEDCNKRLVDAVARGITSIGLDFCQSPDLQASDIETLLKGIDTGEINIHVRNLSEAHQTPEFLGEVFDLVAYSPAQAEGSLGVEPLGKLIKTGTLEEKVFKKIPEIISAANTAWPKFKVITIDTGHLQDAGSTLSQELAYGLSMANEYFSQLVTTEIEKSVIANSIMFEFVSGPNYFMEIAKLRAARWLWKVLLGEWGLKPDSHPMYIHSRTASWNMTVYDANVNMLRTTTEAMSASLGGSDSISVLPFDKLFNDENEFTSRIARNTQIILKEEAYLGKVADPSAGSYYIEQLTEEIANKAWQHFLEVEERGGFLKAFRSGYIGEQVHLASSEKRANAASRRSSILGVNQYPNFSELMLEQAIEFSEEENNQDTSLAIPAFRIAEEFEELRMETEKSGRRPEVFLLKYGDPVWMTARAMFSGNFFACAGYEIIDRLRFNSLETGLDAAEKSGADIIVFCSSDQHYMEIGPSACKRFKGKAELVIAGYPKDTLEKLQAAGIEHFIHVKSNLLEELKKFNSLLLK